MVWNDRVQRVVEDRDRGSTLVLVAMVMIIILISGALALDLSALSRRGQSLQNAADAAALAGVRTWVETGDQAQAEAQVASLMAQNDIDGADTTVVVTFPSSTEIDVEVSDSDPDVYLGSIVGFGGDIGRGATARFEMCDQGCTREVEIPPPFESVEAVGSGDGYKPIPVGDRLYAIHHGGSEIVCVDRSSQGTCWGSAATDAYPSGHGGHNPQMPHTAVDGDLIWWSASDSQGHKLFCWNSVTDQPCPNPYLLDDLPQATALDYRDEMRGGGTVMVNGLIYVFTDNHRAHCFDPATRTICGGYEGGLETALGEANFPPNDPAEGNHGGSIDRIVHEDKIYSVLKIVNSQAVDSGADCSSPLYTPTGRVVLRNVATGRYLATDSSLYNQTEPEANGDLGRARWDVTPRSGNEWRFQNQANGRYLDGDGGLPTELETSGSPASDDDWNLRSWNGSSWRIRNDRSPYGYIRDTGSDIMLYSSTSSSSDRWEIWPWQCAVHDYTPPSPPTLPYDEGTWLHCWDTVTAAPCADFEASRIHTNGLRFNGRLFFYRDSDGVPEGVCSTGFNGSISSSNFEVKCVYLSGQGHDGAINAAQTSVMDSFENAIDNSVPSSPSSWGDPHWNEMTNRLYYPSHHNANTVYCWDFGDGSYCGSRLQQSESNGDTEDYGYFSEGNCVYGLGHNSVFWAFAADDMDEPCSGSSASTRIYPCNCGVTQAWGTLEFDVDLSFYDVFDVQFIDPDGNIIQIDGSDVWSLIDDGVEVDLGDVPTSHEYLTIVVTVEAEGDPWANGAQTFYIDFSRLPVLTG